MATKQQIPVLAARLVEFQEEFLPLSTEDAQWAIMNGKDAAALCAQAIANRIKETAEKEKKNAKVVASILGAVVSTATISASIKKFVIFVVKDKFKVDTSREAKVKISYLGDDFKKWFLGKTEESFAGSIVYGRKLDKGSVDGPILNELGGSEKAKTTMVEVYVMIERQANGESGDLLNNGWANIFYVCDINGILRAVRVDWGGGGWAVRASSVENPYEWSAGRRVFSRNSLVSKNI